jgi:hypothetical protein
MNPVWGNRGGSPDKNIEPLLGTPFRPSLWALMQPWETFRTNAQESVEAIGIGKKDRQKIFNRLYYLSLDISTVFSYKQYPWLFPNHVSSMEIPNAFSKVAAVIKIVS